MKCEIMPRVVKPKGRKSPYMASCVMKCVETIMKCKDMYWIVIKLQWPTDEIVRNDDEHAMKNQWTYNAMNINGMSKQALHGLAKQLQKESLTWAAFQWNAMKVMKHVETWWNVLNRDERGRNAMKRNETRWNAMKRDEARWNVMKRYETRWNAMKRDETRWNAMERYETWWNVMKRGGTWWNMMKRDETWWNVTNCEMMPFMIWPEATKGNLTWSTL